MSLFGKKRKDKPKSKRLKNVFKRRKNQFPQTPDGMHNIQTPNPDKANSDGEEDEDNKQSEEVILTTEQSMEQKFGSKYKYLSDIGAGAFGKVVKAKRKAKSEKEKSEEKGGDTSKVDETYAIKVVGNIFSSNAKAKRFLRELRILRLLSSHESIIELVDLVPPKNPLKFTELCIVFEYMPTDMKKILRSKQYFSTLHIQYIIYQVLLGMKFVHTAGIVHRDLKPENITIDENCTVRLIDFGLARGVAENVDTKQIDIKSGAAEALGIESPKEEAKAEQNGEAKDQKKKLTNTLTKHVVTRWYRSPEVILLQQERKTLYAVDVWSVGCIFGELLQMHVKNCSDYKKRKVLFPGKTCFPFSTKDPFDYQHRTDQLRVVFDLIGTPSEHEIQYYKDKNVRIYLSNMSKSKAHDIAKMYPATKKSGIKLLQDMLTFDVGKRISVEEALKSEYFDDVRDENSEKRHLKTEKFEFEDIEIKNQMLRALILDEVVYFNPEWKKQLKKEYKKKAKQINM